MCSRPTTAASRRTSNSSAVDTWTRDPPSRRWDRSAACCISCCCSPAWKHAARSTVQSARTLDDIGTGGRSAVGGYPNPAGPRSLLRGSSPPWSGSGLRVRRPASGSRSPDRSHGARRVLHDHWNLAAAGPILAQSRTVRRGMSITGSVSPQTDASSSERYRQGPTRASRSRSEV